MSRIIVLKAIPSAQCERRRHPSRQIAIVVLWLSAGLVAHPLAGEAAEFLCRSGDAHCLVNAIDQANDNGQTNTIVLERGRYVLTESFPNNVLSDIGPSAFPTVSSTLSIIGKGGDKTIIENQGDRRIVQVSESGRLTLQGLAITNGVALAGTATQGGGAVWSTSDSPLTLDGVVLSSNDAWLGGAIFSVGRGGVILTNSWILGNRGHSEGGGIFIEGGPLIVSNSVVYSNGTDPTAEAGTGGGGIFAESSATVTIRGSTIASNFGQIGTAIIARGETSISNSTISDNISFGPFSTGAVAIEASATLVHVTVSNNASGGLRSGRVKNSLIVDNHGREDFSDCASRVTSLGNNIDSDGSCGLTNVGDRSAVLEPLVSPRLLDHGGPTPTHALLPLPGSAAIDAIRRVNCTDEHGVRVQVDQRGVRRPQPSGSKCDVGAFEARYLSTEGIIEQVHDLHASTGGGFCSSPLQAFSIGYTFTNVSTVRLTSLIFTVVSITDDARVADAVGGSPTGGPGSMFEIALPNGRLRPGEAVMTPVVVCAPSLSPTFALELDGTGGTGGS